jgi:hypothetical protein
VRFARCFVSCGGTLVSMEKVCTIPFSAERDKISSSSSYSVLANSLALFFGGGHMDNILTLHLFLLRRRTYGYV